MKNNSNGKIKIIMKCSGMKIMPFDVTEATSLLSIANHI